MRSFFVSRGLVTLNWWWWFDANDPPLVLDEVRIIITNARRPLAELLRLVVLLSLYENFVEIESDDDDDLSQTRRRGVVGVVVGTKRR